MQRHKTKKETVLLYCLYLREERREETAPKSTASNDESGFPLKNGWGCCEYDSWRGKEDYYELRIFPDGTCIKVWRFDSTDECGSLYGSFKKPYEELVSVLENGDSITPYIEWDDELPF